MRAASALMALAAASGDRTAAGVPDSALPSASKSVSHLQSHLEHSEVGGDTIIVDVQETEKPRRNGYRRRRSRWAR